MGAADETRRAQRRQWAASAAGWDRWFDWYRRNFGPVMEWCCDATRLAPGHRVLDIASGTGLPALLAARCVAPDGEVLGVDLAAEMVEASRRRAACLDVRNVAFREMDAEALSLPDAGFDAVTFACGLMFCASPARAMREARRVLRPGGRLAAVVWDDPSRNPFFTVIGRAAARALDQPPPRPDEPAGFRLAPPGALEAVLREGGFTEFRIESLTITPECASAAEYMEMFCDFAGTLGAKLAALPAEDAARFRTRVDEGTAPYRVEGGLRLPATALCASGVK